MAPAPEEVPPPLVARARALATEAGFALTREEALRGAADGSAPRSSTSLPGVGRFLFADDPRVRVLTGDSLELIAGHAPFDLLFADGGGGDHARLVDLLAVGGRVADGDVTPRAALPPDSPFRDHDPKGSPSSVTPGWCRSRSCSPICATPCWSAPGRAEARPRLDPPGRRRVACQTWNTSDWAGPACRCHGCAWGP